MIMGASHITLGCDDVEAAIEQLAGPPGIFHSSIAASSTIRQTFVSVCAKRVAHRAARSDHGFPID